MGLFERYAFYGLVKKFVRVQVRNDPFDKKKIFRRCKINFTPVKNRFKYNEIEGELFTNNSIDKVEMFKFPKKEENNDNTFENKEDDEIKK